MSGGPAKRRGSAEGARTDGGARKAVGGSMTATPRRIVVHAARVCEPTPTSEDSP